MIGQRNPTCLKHVTILRWKTALALKRSCNFSREKIERINTVVRHVLLHEFYLKCSIGESCSSMKIKHVTILRWKTALALKRSCNFSREKIERINTVVRHVLLHEFYLKCSIGESCSSMKITQRTYVNEGLNLANMWWLTTSLPF